MAVPKPDKRLLQSFIFYKLKVHPDSRQEKISRKGPDSFEIWIKAPAERGLANSAALRLLASELGIEAKKIQLVKGAQSPSKIVKIIETINSDD